MNKKIDRIRPELHPIPVKSPWYHLGMDFVGPISPVSSLGNRFILTVTDYFTKFGWAKALPTKEAINVIHALREVSIPKCLIYFIIKVIFSCFTLWECHVLLLRIREESFTISSI